MLLKKMKYASAIRHQLQYVYGMGASQARKAFAKSTIAQSLKSDAELQMHDAVEHAAKIVYQQYYAKI